MIEKVYSKISPDILLNIVYTNENIEATNTINRVEITEQENTLQAMHYEIPKDTTIKPHKHNDQERKTDKTNEGFVIFKGSVELSIFDLDNTLIKKIKLKEGDSSIILAGGHSIRTLVPTSLFEFKNGPYYGPEKDRTYF